MLFIAKPWATLGRLMFAGALMLFFAGCQPAGPKALLDGERLIREGDYKGALRSLKIAAELIPQNPQVWNHIGLAHHGMGNTVDAANAYRRALTIERNLSPVYFNLGNLFLEENKLPEATAALTSYTLLNSKDPQGWNKLGVAHLRARRPDDAERAFVNGLKLDPKDPELHNNYGLVHLQRKRPREALHEFNLALQAYPQYGPALLNQAIIAQFHLGNKQAALDRYRAYVSLRPTPENAPEIKAMIARLEAELEPSEEVRLAAIERNVREAAAAAAAQAQPPPEQPPAQPSNNVSRPVEVAQVPPSAVKPANNAAQSAPTNASPTPDLVVAAAQTNKLAPTNVVVAQPSPPPRTQTVAAVTSPKTNEVAIAPKPTPPIDRPPAEAAPESPREPIVTVAVAQEPQIKPVRDILDNASPAPASPQNQTNETLVAASAQQERPLLAPRPKKDDPKVLERINPLSWFRDRDDQPSSQSRTQNQPVTRTTPENPPARPAPTPAFTAPPENPQIAPAPAPQQPPSYPRYPYKKNAQLTKGQTTEAERLFQQGALMQEEKRFGAAIDLYRQAISKDPSYFQAYYNLGIVAYLLKDLPLALGANEQAVQLKPSSTDARYNFALTLRDANYPVDAANELRELLVDAPNEVRAHFMLANLYAQKLNQPFLARRHYEKVLELEPRHREASNIRYWLASN